MVVSVQTVNKSTLVITSVSATPPLNPWMRIIFSFASEQQSRASKKHQSLITEGCMIPLIVSSLVFQSIICISVLCNSVFHLCPCLSGTAEMRIHFVSVSLQFHKQFLILQQRCLLSMIKLSHSHEEPFFFPS